MWVAIEKELTHPYPVQAFITQTSDVIPYDKPILTFSQETWQATHKIMGLNPNLTNKTSLWHNKSLRIGRKTFSCGGWVKLGIVYISDLFDGDQFLSFEQLRVKYKLSNKDFWNYLQLRSCVLSHIKQLPLSPRTEIQIRLEQKGHSKKKIACFYKLFRESQPPGFRGFKRCWEKDIGEEIFGEIWAQIIGSWFKVSREMQTRLISYKIINRIYWTPRKMAQLGLSSYYWMQDSAAKLEDERKCICEGVVWWNGQDFFLQEAVLQIAWQGRAIYENMGPLYSSVLYTWELHLFLLLLFLLSITPQYYAQLCISVRLSPLDSLCVFVLFCKCLFWHWGMVCMGMSFSCWKIIKSELQKKHGQ